MHIRRAVANEAALLTELSLRSKAVWGYDEEFIARCRAELTLTPSFITQAAVYVAEDQERVVGFYALTRHDQGASLDSLFIDPPALRRGYGKALWQHAVKIAAQWGARYIILDADPQAEPFYLAIGAKRVGEAPSGSIPGRALPQLRFDLP